MCIRDSAITSENNRFSRSFSHACDPHIKARKKGPSTKKIHPTLFSSNFGATSRNKSWRLEKNLGFGQNVEYLENKSFPSKNKKYPSWDWWEESFAGVYFEIGRLVISCKRILQVDPLYPVFPRYLRQYWILKENKKYPSGKFRDLSKSVEIFVIAHQHYPLR